MQIRTGQAWRYKTAEEAPLYKASPDEQAAPLYNAVIN
jgi:hypothetical protein